MFQTTTESSTNQSTADFEPDEQWKSHLKVNIESGLRSMVDEAKQNLNDTLKRAPVNAVERERLSKEHLATMKNIRNLAEEQFRIALERERQERRWTAGQTLDEEWSDSMIREQKAILEQIERERKDKAAHPSSSSSQPIADSSISHFSRSPERVWTPHKHTESEHEADYFPRSNNRELEEDHGSLPRNIGKAHAGSVSSGVGLYKPPSALDTIDRGFERPKPSPTIDELDDIPRSTPSRSATDAQDSIRRGSLGGKDAQMSRIFSMARRGNTASTTSSYQAPSVLNTLFSSKPHDMMPTGVMERERDRISAAEQEWSSMDVARDRERTASYTYAEARATVSSTPQRLDDRYPPHLSSVAPIPSSANPYPRPAESPSSTAPIGYTRSSDSSRPRAPPPSASRPIVTKKSFTFDDCGLQSSPSPKDWNGPSRSPYDTRYETSRSPQTPEEVPRSWQSSSLRARLSSQDMRYGYNASETAYYAARPVHTHHEVSEGEYDVDLDDAEWREYDERQMRQREDDFSLRREEEVARREQELRRREEDARREEETKLKEDDPSRKEEETKSREDEIRRKGVEARWRQEEADRKELEIRRMEEARKKKEEETKRKEDEIQRKEMLAKKKEEEVSRKEAQAKKRAADLRRQEVARRLEDDKQKAQQEEFRKRAEEIRRQRAEHTKKPGYNYFSPEPRRPTPPSQVSTSQSQSQSSSSSTGPLPIPARSRSTSTSRSSATWWTAPTRPSSTTSSQSSSTPKLPTPSAQRNAKAAPAGLPQTLFSAAEFHRDQAEQVQRREEQFRREQTKSEQERLLKVGKALNLQYTSTIKLFEDHRGQWDKLQMSGVLIWDNFPWPVFKRPSGPDDITTPGITAYMLSSLHPIDKSLRHRVKENIRRWHHDRFETWLLPKVKESDRGTVREAANTVARTLYHLLRSGTQDADVLTAGSQPSSILKPPILLPQQNANVASHPTHTPISEVKVHRSEIEQARQREEQFHLEQVKLKEILKEEQLAREKECNSLKPHENTQPQAELLPNTSISPSPETTATEEEASQELPGSVSDSLEDLTNKLKGKPSFPAASGGFGDIWKCDLVKPGETVQVAVKTIRSFESDNEEMIRKNAKRVRRELKVWGRLKHHSILPLWGVATDFGPYPAMICPWADNGALTGFLKREQDSLSSLDKFSLLNDIALGLQYLHSKSIVHGDLTGSNVLIDGMGRACLADFGLSTIILEFIGTSYFTSNFRGNVRWVDAELCEASEDDEVSLTTECDIYSFGSITLQVLTCMVPYYNVRKDITVLGQVMKGMKPKPPKESHIAPGHWEFIQRCWLPRASRPSVAEIVMFIARERQALSS